MTDTIFGSYVIDSMIGNAVQSTLEMWMPTYMGFVYRQLVAAGIDIEPFTGPKSYVISSDPYRLPEEQTPSVLIVIPGTLGKPIRDGQQNYRAIWDVRVTTFVEGPNRAATEALAKYYATGVRMALVQKPSLGNFAEGTSWTGTHYSVRVADTAQRTYNSAENRFEVDVRDVVEAFVGPSSPDTGTPADWPIATEVKATLTPVALDALE